MTRVNPKDYYCSKHGPNGEPTCNECWINLFRLANAHNAFVIGTHEDIKRNE